MITTSPTDQDRRWIRDKTTWTRGLRALDVDSVLDLHTAQLGGRGSHAGAKMIVGVPHCPATPEAFDAIARPDRLAASSDLDVFTGKIEKREQWALRRVAGPDSDGVERYECPARAGKLRCPLVSASMSRSVSLPKVLDPPSPAAHRCCSQRTITVPGDVDYKSRQRHYWGSRDWINSFNRRTRVEGWFGNLKDRSREALARGGFRVMGICKSSLMLAIYAARPPTCASSTPGPLEPAWRRHRRWPGPIRHRPLLQPPERHRPSQPAGSPHPLHRSSHALRTAPRAPGCPGSTPRGRSSPVERHGTVPNRTHRCGGVPPRRNDERPGLIRGRGAAVSPLS